MVARRQRGVKWQHVLKYQTHGAWLVLIAAAIVIGVSHFFAEPKHVRPVRLIDPTIGLPMEPDTVPMSWAVAIPTTALVVTILAVEFGIMHKKQSIAQSLQAFFHTFWMALVGFAVVLAVTEATKPVASRYRPDFLQRCTGTYDPTVPANNTDWVILPAACKGKDLAALADGKKSFPSGHSANTLSICWYCVVYLVHALYFRQGFYHMGGLGAKAYSSGRWYLQALMEVLQGLLLLWLCVVLCIAWWIGVSRFTDHRHNIDDILGGFVAALLWMTPIAVISMSQLSHYQKCMVENDAADDHDLQLPLANIPSTASKSASTPAVPGTTVASGTSFHGVNSGGSYAVDAAEPAATFDAYDVLGQLRARIDATPAAAHRHDQSLLDNEAVMHSTARAAQPGPINGSQRYSSVTTDSSPAVLQHLESVKTTAQ